MAWTLIDHPRGFLLATVALNPNEQLDGFSKTSFDDLATNIILPHGPSFVRTAFVAGRPLALPAGGAFSHELQLNDVVALRVGGACLCVRTFALDGAGGQQPQLTLAPGQTSILVGVRKPFV